MQCGVTPYVGVWIETDTNRILQKLVQVTPYVGVWIETDFDRRKEYALHRHTLRGCVD